MIHFLGFAADFMRRSFAITTLRRSVSDAPGERGFARIDRLLQTVELCIAPAEQDVERRNAVEKWAYRVMADSSRCLASRSLGA
jgi:hypothetical protein